MGRGADLEPTQPPRAAWRITAGWQFDPTLLTEVDVRFNDLGNSETEVTLEHRKLENYGEAAAEIAGIFASPGGWDAALTRFSANLEAAAERMGHP